METVVTARVSGDAFALATTFAALPNAEIEVEPVIGEGVMPIVRVRGASRDALDDALETDPSVNRAVRLDDRPDGEAHCYRVDWSGGVERVVRAFTATNGVFFDACRRRGEWRFQLYYPDREDLSKAYERWAEAGIAVDIERIRAIDARSSPTPETSET